MRRTRLVDFRNSRGPKACGISPGDLPGCASIVNAAQERLIYDKSQNDEGWSQTFVELVVAVCRENPYITCPRGVARLESIDVCDQPVRLSNNFQEYLLFGNGRMPKDNRWGRWSSCLTQGFTRNNAVTFTDLQSPPQQIAVFATNPQDLVPNAAGAIPRVMVGGLNAQGSAIWTQDGNNTVMGEFIALASPYGESVNQFSQLTGIQKDVTLGDIQIFQIDPIWGSMELLLTMEPTETTANYRRYYLNGLPANCCNHNRFYLPQKSPVECNCPYPPKQWALVTALAKLDFVPVAGDTDYLTINNLEAVIAECQAVRYSSMDTENAAALEAKNHQQAIRLLIGQLTHEQGKNSPAVVFSPFGSAHLDRLRIGMM